MTDTTPPRHFLDIADIPAPTLRRILTAGTAFRRDGARAAERPLTGKTLICLFEKPSTRSRVSFEIGIRHLGGEAVILDAASTQLGRGESIADTARVLSRYGDAIMLRANSHDTLLQLARNASIPVINGLTDFSHPCQIMADVMTFEQHRGPLTGKTIAWCGDGNNVAVSWVHAAAKFGFALRVATPAPLAVPSEVVAHARRDGAEITTHQDPRAAVDGADCVVTDTWVSMGQTDREQRLALLRPFQVDEALMRHAAPEALFLHCLPAHRGEEVTAAVLDGPQSLVWDEAENRLHAQKGILAWCLEAA